MPDPPIAIDSIVYYTRLFGVCQYPEKAKLPHRWDVGDGLFLPGLAPAQGNGESSRLDGLPLPPHLLPRDGQVQVFQDQFIGRVVRVLQLQPADKLVGLGAGGVEGAAGYLAFVAVTVEVGGGDGDLGSQLAFVAVGGEVLFQQRQVAVL